MDFGPVGGYGGLLVEKGSVAVNGVSLTCFEVSPGSFRVAVIPHTMEKTNLCSLQPGEPVNVEFDVLGKYVARLMGRT
jgi:riboflavin synthase